MLTTLLTVPTTKPKVLLSTLILIVSSLTWEKWLWIIWEPMSELLTTHQASFFSIKCPRLSLRRIFRSLTIWWSNSKVMAKQLMILTESFPPLKCPNRALISLCQRVTAARAWLKTFLDWVAYPLQSAILTYARMSDSIDHRPHSQVDPSAGKLRQLNSA